MLRKISPEIFTLALLVPLALILGLLVVRAPIGRTPAPSPSAQQVSPEATPVSVTDSTAAVQTSVPPALAALTPTPQARVGLAIVTPTGRQEYEVSVLPGASVSAVMQAARALGVSVQTKDFGGSLGLFVEAINGLSNNAGDELYWTLYVNGQRSPLGASSATVQPGDVVTWKYEKVHVEE